MALGFLYGSGGGSGIPNGASVTPVGDVYTWQKCAGIANPQYTTLAEILADATTLEHVIDSANATDYLVRSKTWINDDGYGVSIPLSATAMSLIGANNYASDTLLADSDWCEAICDSSYFESVLNTKVPVMTSNTTPSGTASAISERSGDETYKAFDSNEGTRWVTNTAGTAVDPSTYIRYVFPSKVKIFKVSINAEMYENKRTVYQWAISASDDGTTFNASLGTIGDSSNTSEQKVSAIINNPAEYLGYNLQVVSGNSYARAALYELQFYGRKDV